MKDSRLWVLLETLCKKEMREFRKFTRSPFFNQREDVVQLYDYLVECLTLHKVVPTKRQVFLQVYDRQKGDYDDHKVRLIMSFLFKLMERYLLVKELLSEEVKTKTRLAEIYRKRDLPAHSQRCLKEVVSLQKKRLCCDADSYEDSYRLHLEKYHFASVNNRMNDVNLQAVSDNLDIAYISRKLRHACLSLSHQAVSQTEYDFGFLSEIISFVKRKNLHSIPTIGVYFFGYQAFTEPSKLDYFRQFKELILEKGEQFHREEVGDLYILAINFCIKRYNEGNADYLKEEFDLYKEGLKKGYLNRNGYLSRFSYLNAVTVGLVLRDFEWVESCIFDFRDALEAPYRESAFSFNLARLEYERKHYDAALRLLQKSEYKDLLLNLAAKTVLLKIYFEITEWDALSSHLEAMKMFIRRKKVMGYHRENYLNTIKFTKKLVELNPADKEKKVKLLAEIEAAKAVAEKRWLIHQLNQF